MHSSARRLSTALLCTVAFIAAGCHNNNLDSGYGVAWVTLTDDPGDFASYRVNIDSVTLTRSDGAVVTALGTVESVDFTQLKDISELWGTATIPTGTYLSASITLDYTAASTNIAVMVNGAPVKATVVGPTGLTGSALTTVVVDVLFDPANPLVLNPTYATTAAQRLALNFNLAASTESIDLTTSPPTVTVKPYFTAGISPPDTKLVRVRGPLINSSVGQDTYTVYVRPFTDEVDALGQLTLFNDANTVYTINGSTYVGTPGITNLSQTSAGTTITAAYTTYEPTATPSATAGIWHPKYVVAGSTLQDAYTQGLEGDVIARAGNVLTVRGSTLHLNDGVTTYNEADASVTIGAGTSVTIDDSTVTGLNYNSVSVGQHIIARGIYSLVNGVVLIDATGSSTNTGSIRLMPTAVIGALISAGANNELLNVTTINDWPVSIFNFAGTGLTAATNANPASYAVSTGTLAVPDTTPGDTVWAYGTVAPFASAPPDFNATVINTEATQPASLQVTWTGGTTAPFSALSASGISVDLSNATLASAVIRFGDQTVPMSTLPASPVIVPATGTASSTTTGTGGVVLTLPATYTPLFSVGDPTAVATTGTTFAPTGIHVYSAFSSYVTQLTTVLPTTPALQLVARGLYDRATNTFTASSMNVVL